MNTNTQEIPGTYAPLIGEAVTLYRAYEKVGYGLREWEIIAKTDGGVSFPVKAFIELKYAFELAGIELSETAQGSDWSANPLYTATVAWDYKHKRLSFDKVMLPNGSKVTLDIEAFGKRRENREAPIMPVLRGKAPTTPIAPMESSKPLELPAMPATIADKLALMERLGNELLASYEAHSIEYSTTALLLMNIAVLQGKKVAPPKRTKQAQTPNADPAKWNPKSPARLAREAKEPAEKAE